MSYDFTIEQWVRRVRPGSHEPVMEGPWVNFRSKEDGSCFVRAYVGPPEKEPTLSRKGPDDRPNLIVDMYGRPTYRIPLDCCCEFHFRAAVVTASAYWLEKPGRGPEKFSEEVWLCRVHDLVYRHLVDNRNVAMHANIVRFGQMVRDTYGANEDAQLRHAYDSIRHEIRRFSHRISEEDLVRLYRESVVEKVLTD